MKIRVAIIDDERLARQKIRTMLASHGDIDIVAECENGSDAVAAIRKEKPDVAFLDVQMPGLSGFDVLRKLAHDPLPVIVFVTAFNDYAVRAFEVEAVDYLLKPFDRKRFNEALVRVRRSVESRRSGTIEDKLSSLLDRLSPDAKPPAPAPPSLDQFVVKVRDRMFFVRPEEVDWIGAEGKYVRLHIGTDSHLLRESIGDLERRLDGKEFLRIHRATIVNVRRVKEMFRGFAGDYFVILRDGTRLSLSRRYRARLRHVAGLPL